MKRDATTRSSDSDKASSEKLKAALKKVESKPTDQQAWDEAEAAAAETQKPDEVAAAYRHALGPELGPDAITALGQRGLHFLEEWYAGETPVLVDFLELVLKLDGTADWALERLTILRSVNQQWNELLAAYDRLLDGLADGARRRRLLRDAASVARDSGSTARAARYLQSLFEATPGNLEVSSELEHLLERQADWSALAKVLSRRLTVVSGHDAVELGERLAGYYLDHLGEPGKALDEIEKVLASPAVGDDRAACAVTERVLADEKAPHDIRHRALGILRARHLQQGRLDRMVAAVRVALTFSGPGETRALVNEAADMLERKGDLEAAREQLVELVAIGPEQAATRARLKYLAEITATPEAYVRGLVAAAEATGKPKLQVALWLEAAQIEEARKGGTEAAIALYRKTLASEAATPEQVLLALRKLSGLLEGDAHADERLDVLERQASLEPAPGARRGLLGEAADLARARGQEDRALKLWDKRLSLDKNDRKALARTIEILEGARRWPELVAALARRANADVPWAQRRADLLRVAEIERDQRKDAARAIAALGKILETAPGDSEAVAAILDLFADSKQWQPLLDLGTREGRAAQQRLVSLFVRLGEACAQHLADPKGGALWYGRALAIAPETKGLRDALFALLDDESARGFAVDGILRCAAASDDWQALLAVLPHRLALAASDDEKARLHREAAGLEEKRAQHVKEALGHFLEVLRLRPDDPEAETEILRLAAATGDFTGAARGFEQAGVALPSEAPRKVLLLLLGARLYEDKVGDKPAALACFEKAFKSAPADRGARLGVVRLASQQGRWQSAVDAALAEPFDAAVLVADFLPLMEQAAKAAADPAEACLLLGKLLSTALAKKPGLPAAMGRIVEERIADYPVGAEKQNAWREKALLRARDYDPTQLSTMRRLAEVQRPRGGKPLYETLMQIAQLAPRELEPLAAALEVGLEKKDSSLARTALLALFDRAVALVRAGQPAEGKLAAADALVDAAQEIARLLGGSRDKSDVRRAVDCLLEASRVPIAPDVAQAMRSKAGELAADVDKRLARDLLRQAVDQDPKNRTAAKALAKLYEEADLLNDLLVLRRRELEDAASASERIELRLELARLGEIVENRTGRFEMLLANLEDSAGHPATMAAIASLLRSRGRFAELADILAAQAKKLEDEEERPSAAGLWHEAAVLCEQQLGDHARAIAAYEKVVKLGGDPSAMEALARLYESAGEPLAAASWLEQRLATGAPAERREAVLKLAQTYLTGGQRHRAVAALERGLGEDPKAAALWDMLARLHREAGHHEALLRVLIASSAQLEDPAAVVAAAEEALGLSRDQLGNPALAVPILERAVALAPDQRALRLALADGLRVSGKLAEARAALESVLQEYGRRQSRERALLHLQIATVARAEKNPELAAQHLDQAATVLLDSIDVQLALAEVAEERGDLERAEKAYRALLVLARRGHGEGAMTAGEVLVRLRRLAMTQKQQAQANENLESLMARALHDPIEARRIQAALLADGDHDTLLDLLGKRRASAASIADEALVVCELASALEKMGRAEDGLGALLEIIVRVPDSIEAHTLARGLAARLGKAATYLDTVTAAADKLRRADDASCLADLLLRAADVAENDLQMLEKAQGFLRRAEQTGRRSAEVMSALARIAALAGDAAEQARAVAGLRRLAEQAGSFAEKADLYYRLAEAQASNAEMRDEGLDALAKAVELHPDLPRATAIVESAKVPDSALVRVLPVYEKVARAAKDEHVLLDFLERRAALTGVKLGDVREGVELAVSLGEGERAERLLSRAVEVARAASGGLREGIWAVAELARRLRSRGDLVGAAHVLDEARDEWANPRLTPLVREIAKAAAANPETISTAARLYEQLRVVYPTDREVWEPLLDLLAKLGDRPELQSLVEDLVEKLMSRGERGAVRMAWARFLLQSGDNGEATSAALRDVLLEEPGHPQALTLLADIYEQRGDVSEAVNLLSEALSNAEGAADSAGRATLARRLGDLVRKADPGQAKEVYRSALAAVLPDPAVKRSLQLSLAELLTGEGEGAERAGLLEEVLRGEHGDGAATQALTLFELRLGVGDLESAERALQLGRERAPGHPQLFERSRQFFTEHERWSDLARLCVEEAARQRDPAKATSLLRQVAALQREKAGDIAGAAHTLRRAAQLDPGDIGLVRELCDVLEEAGDPVQALAATGEILAATKGPARVGILRLRAELASKAGDDVAAATDLEEALSLGDKGASPELAAALSRAAARAAEQGRKDEARRATLRLAEVMRTAGDHEQADQVLFRWIEATPDDRDVLLRMRDIFTAAERWESAANVWARLVHLEEDGEAKVEAVLAMTDACEKLGRGEEAIPWLSGVLGMVPGNRTLQGRLATLYAAAGNIVEAARLRAVMADSEPDENERFHLYVQIGQALLAVGEGAEAAAALEKATALPPADRTTRVLLLDAYTVAGAFERAQALLTELLADMRNLKSEELALLYQRQAKLAATAGDRDGQLAGLKKAFDVDRKSIAIASELADLAEAMGDDDLALRALRVVAANPVKDAKALAVAYLRQARIAHRGKDRARAIIFVKRALQEDPTLEEGKALLDELR